MARVVRFHTHGGPEVLRIEEIEAAPPGMGEVQISVKALGLNRAETLMRRGTYIETPMLPSKIDHLVLNPPHDESDFLSLKLNTTTRTIGRYSQTKNTAVTTKWLER